MEPPKDQAGPRCPGSSSRVFPQVHDTKVLTSSDRVRHPVRFLKHSVSLPQASPDWTNEDTFFFIERDKRRTRDFNNKNSNESKDLRLSLEHMWVIRGLRK